jgi:3'(2'), 5'-bisphosphate nucleotidase
VTPPTGEAAFAGWLAARAGEELLALRQRRGLTDPDGLRAAADRHAHDLITGELARWRPDDAVLSEEQVVDDPVRLTADRVWIVDPLDGTSGFGRGGGEWAVQIALWVRGEGLVAGAVALPTAGRVLVTDPPPAVPPAPADRAPRVAVSRSRAPAYLVAVVHEVGAELVRMSSAGVKVAAVVAGEVDAYLHDGGQYEWDSAAPVAVAVAAGLYASRVDGSPLAYNRPDPTLPDLLVCRPDLAPPLLAAVARQRD